jgi:hypothetical protein
MLTLFTVRCCLVSAKKRWIFYPQFFEFFSARNEKKSKAYVKNDRLFKSHIKISRASNMKHG